MNSTALNNLLAAGISTCTTSRCHKNYGKWTNWPSKMGQNLKSILKHSYLAKRTSKNWRANWPTTLPKCFFWLTSMLMMASLSKWLTKMDLACLDIAKSEILSRPNANWSNNKSIGLMPILKLMNKNIRGTLASSIWRTHHFTSLSKWNLIQMPKDKTLTQVLPLAKLKAKKRNSHRTKKVGLIYLLKPWKALISTKSKQLKTIFKIN